MSVSATRLSTWLIRVWFAAVALAGVVAALLCLVPNEGLDHFGSARMFTYAVWLVLSVAIVSLPLLLIAALLERRAK
jgi:hypothetical protein